MVSVSVVVVGSCMMDIVVSAPHIPVRGETVIGTSVATYVGGKGCNQAIAASRMGADVRLIGKVGGDAFGAEVRAAAEQAGVDCSGLANDPLVPTGIAVPIVLPDGDNSILAIPQANMALAPSDVERQAESIAIADVLLLQFEVAMDANLTAARLASASETAIVLNTAPLTAHPPELLALADIIVANETEAAGLCPGVEEPEQQALALAEVGRWAAIVTLGSAGLVLATKDAPGVRQSAFPVTALDTVGAGDAFCGALAVTLAGGADLPDAARTAQAASALSVTRAGAAQSLPTIREVKRFLSSQERRG